MVCVCLCGCLRAWVCMQLWVFVCAAVSVCVQLWVFVCAWMCVRVCFFVLAYVCSVCMPACVSVCLREEGEREGNGLKHGAWIDFYASKCLPAVSTPEVRSICYRGNCREGLAFNPAPWAGSVVARRLAPWSAGILCFDGAISVAGWHLCGVNQMAPTA